MVADSKKRHEISANMCHSAKTWKSVNKTRPSGYCLTAPLETPKACPNYMSKSPSVIQRVIAILNAFNKDKALITIEEMSGQLDLSVASTYRYLSELTRAGLLSRTSGSYRLGPKIIELEYLFRSYDPILQASRDLMQGLASFTGCSVLLCNVYDQALVNVMLVDGKEPIEVAYQKGEPMPLFKGAQAINILANMDVRKLKRLYETSIKNPDIAPDIHKIGADWPRFLKRIREIRSQGYYVSHDQIDPGVSGIAAPVFGANHEVISSLVLIYANKNPPSMAESTLIDLVVHGAQQLSNRLETMAGEESAARAVAKPISTQ